MDFLMASGIFALVFVGVLIFTSSRGSEVEQQREVARRLTRPADEIEIDVMRKARPQEGTLLAGLYNLTCSRKLEQAMWQAGMYMRVPRHPADHRADVRRGIVRRQLFFGDMWFALGTALMTGSLPLLYIQFARSGG